MSRTETAVHDEKSSLRQRQRALHDQRRLMLALSAAGQLISFGAMYLLPAAANAAWQALLLQLLPAGALALLGAALRRTAPPGAAALPAYRAAAGVLALLFFSNMNVSFLSLVELTHVFFFPSVSRLLLALAAAGALGLGIPAADAAVPNAARMLRWFLAGAFLFCAATVLPTAETAYLFPLAGYGVGHTLRCAALTAGSVWATGAAAVLYPNAPGCPNLRGRLAPAVVILLAALMFFFCALVLPGPALAAPRGYAVRLQLLMEMSPNTLSWSLMLLAEMLLYLTAFAVCAHMLRRSLRLALRWRRAPLLPFALLCVPLALAGMSESEGLLTRLLPWRYPLAAAILAECLLCNLILKRKGKKA